MTSSYPIKFELCMITTHVKTTINRMLQVRLFLFQVCCSALSDEQDAVISLVPTHFSRSQMTFKKRQFFSFSECEAP